MPVCVIFTLVLVTTAITTKHCMASHSWKLEIIICRKIFVDMMILLNIDVMLQYFFVLLQDKLVLRMYCLVPDFPSC